MKYLCLVYQQEAEIDASVEYDAIVRDGLEYLEEPGKNLAIQGSASIVQSFANLGLIDDLRLMVHPVV